MTEYSGDRKLFGYIVRHRFRLQMCSLFLGAVSVVMAQHFFYNYLHHKPTNYNFFGNSSFSSFIRQYYISIGNVLSITSKALLCGALANVFVQTFWLQHNRERFSVEKIDKALSCKDGPVSSLMAIRSTSLLSTLALLIAAMDLITVFAPGAVKPEATSITQPCTVSTVNLSHAPVAVFIDTTGAYVNPIAQLRGFVNQVFLSGTYMSPTFARDQYGGSVSYSVDFDAPTLNCTNVTSSFDFATSLPSPPLSNNASITDKIVVWNTTRFLNSSDGSLFITIATRKLLPTFDEYKGVNPYPFPTATTCTPYRSLYTVTINTGSSNGTLPSISIRNVVPKSPLSVLSVDSEEMQLYAIADTFVAALNGTVIYDPNSFDFTPDSQLVGYSPLGAADADSPWSWNVDMLTAIPQVMQNISLSILSDKLSETGSPTLKLVNSTCEITNVFFIYEPLRLFSVYGVSLLVSAICIGHGFIAIHANGVEESLSFSRVLSSLSIPGHEGFGQPQDEEKRSYMQDSPLLGGISSTELKES
ncbi:hypothetical protein SCHPADRAFT_929999 [Schizopora paradoxa]|uniref:Uncharacterized protein n=1 Tax=Schizopora paradoxa TaxID=27342 RepID=A0A0H2RI73_9AGAM|nr:hypothetical protein SCHPADRAFT_929999 [Schizopora paradoxa]